jgi:hypothetical protein
LKDSIYELKSATRVRATRRFFFGGSASVFFLSFVAANISVGPVSILPSTLAAGVGGGSDRFAGTVGVAIGVGVKAGRPVIDKDGVAEGSAEVITLGVESGVGAVDDVVSGTECA